VETYDAEGRLHGPSSYWDEQGRPTMTRNNVEGKRHGEQVDFTYEGGKLSSKRVRVYDNGKLISDKTIEVKGD